jgi:hypothetical protein
VAFGLVESFLARARKICLHAARIGLDYRVCGQTNKVKWGDAKNALVFADLGGRNGGGIVLLVVVDFGRPQLDPEIPEKRFSCYPRLLRKESSVPECVARDVPSMIDGVRFVGKPGL